MTIAIKKKPESVAVDANLCITATNNVKVMIGRNIRKNVSGYERNYAKKIEKEQKNNIESIKFDQENNTFSMNMSGNSDSSFIKQLEAGEIKDIFDKVADISLSTHHRITALNSLFLPRMVSRFKLYEQCGLIQRFCQVFD